MESRERGKSKHESDVETVPMRLAWRRTGLRKTWGLGGPITEHPKASTTGFYMCFIRPKLEGIHPYETHLRVFVRKGPLHVSGSAERQGKIQSRAHEHLSSALKLASSFLVLYFQLYPRLIFNLCTKTRTYRIITTISTFHLSWRHHGRHFPVRPSPSVLS